MPSARTSARHIRKAILAQGGLCHGTQQPRRVVPGFVHASPQPYGYSRSRPIEAMFPARDCRSMRSGRASLISRRHRVARTYGTLISVKRVAGHRRKLLRRRCRHLRDPCDAADKGARHVSSHRKRFPRREAGSRVRGHRDAGPTPPSQDGLGLRSDLMSEVQSEPRQSEPPG